MCSLDLNYSKKKQIDIKANLVVFGYVCLDLEPVITPLTSLDSFTGVQYRLEAQKEGIERSKSQALQENSPKTAIQNLGNHYKALYRNALENEPQHQVRKFSSLRLEWKDYKHSLLYSDNH